MTIRGAVAVSLDGDNFKDTADIAIRVAAYSQSFWQQLLAARALQVFYGGLWCAAPREIIH